MTPAFIDAKGNVIPYDGSPVTWRISIYVVVVRNNEVLFAEPGYLGGLLELPGGEVEVGETLLEGATRECWEETAYHFIPDSSGPTLRGRTVLLSQEGNTLPALCAPGIPGNRPRYSRSQLETRL